MPCRSWVFRAGNHGLKGWGGGKMLCKRFTSGLLPALPARVSSPTERTAVFLHRSNTGTMHGGLVGAPQYRSGIKIARAVYLL